MKQSLITMGLCQLLGRDICEVFRFIGFIIFHFYSMKYYFTFRTVFDHLFLLTQLGYQNLKEGGGGEGVPEKIVFNPGMVEALM